MLKIEKTVHLSGLAIRLRERDRFLEPRLLKALAIALALHLGALFLFHVTPFSLSSTFIFPPIQVQSDQPMQGISAWVTSHSEEIEEMTPPPLAMIPTLDWISSPQKPILTPPTLDPLIFQTVEEHLWPKWETPLSLPLEEPHIQLTISGDLAEYPLVATDSLLSQMQPFSPSPRAYYVTYQVQMDNRTGEIFWYECVESSDVAAIDRIAEQILLNLKFTPPPSRETVTGKLNFVVLAANERQT
jgi:hypothetical protein